MSDQIPAQFRGPTPVEIDRACLAAPVRELAVFGMHRLDSDPREPGGPRVTRATCSACAERIHGIDSDLLHGLPWIVRPGSGHTMPVDEQGPLAPCEKPRQIKPFDDLAGDLQRCRELLQRYPLSRCKGACSPGLFDWCQSVKEQAGIRISAGALLLSGVSLGFGFSIAEKVAEIDGEPVAQARLRVRSMGWHRLTWHLTEPIESIAGRSSVEDYPPSEGQA